MLLGLQTAVRPVAGDTDVDKATNPAKLLPLARCTVNVAFRPELKVKEELIAVIVKSGNPLRLTVLVDCPVAPPESVTCRLAE